MLDIVCIPNCSHVLLSKNPQFWCPYVLLHEILMKASGIFIFHHRTEFSPHTLRRWTWVRGILESCLLSLLNGFCKGQSVPVVTSDYSKTYHDTDFPAQQQGGISKAWAGKGCQHLAPLLLLGLFLQSLLFQTPTKHTYFPEGPFPHYPSLTRIYSTVTELLPYSPVFQIDCLPCSHSAPNLSWFPSKALQIL